MRNNPEKISYLDDEDKKEKINNWAAITSEQFRTKNDVKIKELFNDQFKYITPLLWIITYC